MSLRRLAVITLIAFVIRSRPALAALWFNDDLKALPCRPTIACTADIVPPPNIPAPTTRMRRSELLESGSRTGKRGSVRVAGSRLDLGAGKGPSRALRGSAGAPEPLERAVLVYWLD